VLSGTHWFDVASETGDFPILRRDQSPAYQLAVVVDDLHDGVTEVLRGNDLLPSAARQQLLYEALGFASPRWIHVPLVVDSDGHRLAKRTNALSLAALRQSGFRARDILAWVAQSLGLESREIETVHDLIASFRLGRLPNGPVRVLDEFLPTAVRQ
jgi:glutamyl-tRNA synthetase